MCWNTPHGVEGFFVYMGDALTKRGDAATAKAIYANARKAPEYASWPFASVLEDRVAKVDA